jgi:transcriptional antiterminator RfaH
MTAQLAKPFGRESAVSAAHEVDGDHGTDHSPLRWFLVLTKPSGENAAKTNLEKQGYRVYYPRLQHAKLHRGRWIDRIVSLFPRYLFVQVDPVSQSLAPVRSTFGVASIVRFGVEAAVVPGPIVDGLLSCEDPHTGLHRLNIQRPLRPGVAVSVIGGAFEGLQGIFERDVSEERVVILLRLLGQEAPVCVPGHFVVPSLGS